MVMMMVVMMMLLMMIGGLDGLRNDLGFTWGRNGCKNVSKMDPEGLRGVILGCVRVTLGGLWSVFEVCARRAAIFRFLGLFWKQN